LGVSRAPAAGNESAAGAPGAANRCGGSANGKKSDDDAYIAASADSSELSSDDAPSAADLTSAELAAAWSTDDDVLDRESRRPLVERHGDDCTSRPLDPFTLFTPTLHRLDRLLDQPR